MSTDNRTSLVIMAAGIGSRFGQGIKQLTSFGPSGEIIMDYSIYDALQAGFDRIVFVIRKDLEADFREVIGDRIAAHADVSYVFQELRDLPGGYTLPEGRTKPWGTGQAILACKDVVREPFCVINADDYYGRQAYRNIHTYLTQGDVSRSGSVYNMCMSGFILRNTLSENGGVTRGVCSVDADGMLSSIVETKNIIRYQQGAGVQLADGSVRALDPDTAVSMNMWGFGSEFLDMLEEGFCAFLEKHIGTQDEKSAEYLLPTLVGHMLDDGIAKVRVLETQDKWFGVTYQEDIESVRKNLADLAEAGVYPHSLWG